MLDVNKLLGEQELAIAVADDSYMLESGNRRVLQEAVMQSLLAIFDAGRARHFVVVCSLYEQLEFLDILAHQRRLDMYVPHNGTAWLNTAANRDIPTIFFKQCRTGNEKSLAGMRLESWRMFINADYVSQRALGVCVASVKNPHSSITLYREISGTSVRGYGARISVRSCEEAFAGNE